MSQPERARHILNTIGARSAIGYLKARGWSAEAAVYILYQSRRGA